jgi:hypothetical protein
VAAWNVEGRALAEPVIAAGGIVDGNRELSSAVTRVNLLGAKLNKWVRDEVTKWLDLGKVVGVVGGDHSVPFGAIEAIADRHPGLGVLHIDAHADLRDAYEGFTWSHASIMYNVVRKIPDVARLVQVGIRDLCDAEVEVIRKSNRRVITHYDGELATRRFAGENWAGQCERIVEGFGRGLRVVRRRRARSHAVPAHRHAGAGRAELRRGDDARRRGRAQRPAHRRLRSERGRAGAGRRRVGRQRRRAPAVPHDRLDTTIAGTRTDRVQRVAYRPWILFPIKLSLSPDNFSRLRATRRRS